MVRRKGQTWTAKSLTFSVRIRRAAERDLAQAQLWYETQQRGLGAEFYAEVSLIIDRLAETPLVYQIIYRDIRRAIVRRFPYLIWYRVLGDIVTVLACTHVRQGPNKLNSRLR
jgi:toxin ParE1/3/4